MRASLEQVNQFLELFSHASSYQIRQLVEANDLLKLMLTADLAKIDRESFRKVLDTHGQLRKGLFAEVDVQLKNVRRWNEERDWGFSDSQFATLGEPPPWPDDPLAAIVLVPYLRSVPATFDELWMVAASQQKNAWRRDELKSLWRVRLRKGINHRPGLGWAVIDLGARWSKSHGTCPSVVPARDSCHAEVLAAAAHHPEWIHQMDGETVPYVWLAGYETKIEPSTWRYTPTLRWCDSDRRLHLDAGHVSCQDWQFAIPVFHGGVTTFCSTTSS